LEGLKVARKHEKHGEDSRIETYIRIYYVLPTSVWMGETNLAIWPARRFGPNGEFYSFTCQDSW